MQTPSPDVSRITDYLYLSSLPKHEHAEHIWELGVRLIVSLPLYWPPKVYRKPPFAFVHCPTIDSPVTPIPIFMLRRGVHAALPVIERGESVLIHCKSGVHRSVAMATCILIAHNTTADEAMKLVVEQRPVADPYAPHIQSRIRKFERDWQRQYGTS
jgi:protein tyrosine phosphatase (PTP) superfamily phosphohydrolase (DUF442 family)